MANLRIQTNEKKIFFLLEQKISTYICFHCLGRFIDNQYIIFLDYFFVNPVPFEFYFI